LVIYRLATQLNNVLHIGDSLIDAKTALAANVYFAAVTTGTTNENDF
jgi:phosphoglycolate phosphatase